MAKILTEKGAVLNKTNKSLIKQAYEAIKNILAVLPDDSEEVSEASTWSVNDQISAVSKELAEEIPDAHVCDLYPDEKLVVYRIGWYDSKFYQASYTLDDTGVATFGTPIEVSRKVTYVPTSDNGLYWLIFSTRIPVSLHVCNFWR